MKNIEKSFKKPSGKPKSLLDKNLTWVERSYLTDVFIAEEWTKRVESLIRGFRDKNRKMIQGSK